MVYFSQNNWASRKSLVWILLNNTDALPVCGRASAVGGASAYLLHGFTDAQVAESSNVKVRNHTVSSSRRENDYRNCCSCTTAA
jgi:hypothetical protein